MITVSAAALWWYDGAECFCEQGEIRSSCARVDVCAGSWFDDLSFFSGEYAGDRLITDGQLALRINRVTGLEDVPTSIHQLHSAAEASIDSWLAADPMVGVVPDRMFPKSLLDPLEAAGFRVRPINRVNNVHGVCVPDESWRIVGLLTALRRGTVPSEAARAVAL